MATLSELQRQLHLGLRGQQSIDRTAEALGCAPERLGVYAEFVRSHVRTALDKNYPYLQKMLPQALWTQLCERYFESCPSGQWEVNRAAESWAAFLDQQREHESALHPAHIVMAEFEWQQFVTYMHPAVIPDAAAVDELTLNPTVLVLELAYDLLELISKIDADQARELPSPPAADATVVLLYRDPVDYCARAERATPELLFALKVAAESIEVASAAQASGQTSTQVRVILADAALRGLVILPEGWR